MPDTTEETPFTYDPEAAERGWRATASLRAAVDGASLPSIDLDDAAVLALRVSRWLLEPEVRRAFEALPAVHFDHSLIDRIEPAAWALWYSNTIRVTVGATESGGRVSEATLEAAVTRKARMQRVCTYMLADHPKDSLEVASIRSGTGHKDTARDLTRFAALYTKHADWFAEKAGEFYDPADVAGANASAAAILFELGETEAKALKDAKDDTARAFAVLNTAYNRVGRWAAAIWDSDDRMPSLFTVRSSGTSKPRSTTTETGGDTGGGETT